MFTKFQFTNNVSQVVDFLMSPSTSGGYIGLTNFDPEIIDESVDRSRMEANASWPVFNYFVRMLVPIKADMLSDTANNFQTLKIDFLQKIMVIPDFEQTDRLHGTLTIRPSGETHDWDLPVQVKTAPKFDQSGISPAGASFTMTFQSFRPYWYRAFDDTYLWYV